MYMGQSIGSVVVSITTIGSFVSSVSGGLLGSSGSSEGGSGMSSH